MPLSRQIQALCSLLLFTPFTTFQFIDFSLHDVRKVGLALDFGVCDDLHVKAGRLGVRILPSQKYTAIATVISSSWHRYPGEGTAPGGRAGFAACHADYGFV